MFEFISESIKNFKHDHTSQRISLYMGPALFAAYKEGLITLQRFSAASNEQPAKYLMYKDHTVWENENGKPWELTIVRSNSMIFDFTPGGNNA